MQFSDRTAIVTGAAKGIGRAVALRLAAGGARLTLVDRDAESLAALIAELREQGADVLPLILDIADEAAVMTAIGEARARFGRLDLLVNNAAIGLEKPLLETSLADFRRLFAVNLFGLFVMLREAARLMIADRVDGRIVNLASVAGLRGSVGRAAYGATKAAVINLTQTAAVELAAYNIRVNAVAPGPIETELARSMHRPQTRAAWLRAVPQHRYGAPEEAAAAVVWLLSDDARFVTGHVLAVDGGFAACGLFVDLTEPQNPPAEPAEPGEEPPP